MLYNVVEYKMDDIIFKGDFSYHTGTIEVSEDNLRRALNDNTFDPKVKQMLLEGQKWKDKYLKTNNNQSIFQEKTKLTIVISDDISDQKLQEIISVLESMNYQVSIEKR